jgi:hypothetical protein
MVVTFQRLLGVSLMWRRRVALLASPTSSPSLQQTHTIQKEFGPAPEHQGE